MGWRCRVLGCTPPSWAGKGLPCWEKRIRRSWPHIGMGPQTFAPSNVALSPPRHAVPRRGYLEVMLDRVFGESALHLNRKLEAAADSGAAPGAALSRLPCCAAAADVAMPQAQLMPTQATPPAVGCKSVCIAFCWPTPAGEAVDMEACFSQLTLDVIGKAVFNYDFDALNRDTPVIQVCVRVGREGRSVWVQAMC